ncbi:hypothetical protein JW752_01475 [Candidatus Peregrinibacteria bacterium]|nr:hypothetical protein [Candidatus Peregrinibacteria bacterium]
MPEKPTPKAKAPSKAPQSGVDFDIDVSLSDLQGDGTKDQREAAAAFAVGSKRDEILARSRNTSDIERRIRQEVEWNADGLGETEMDIPALPPLPALPLEDKKEEDYEIRMIRFLSGEIQKAEVFVRNVKSDPDAASEIIERAERMLEAHRENYQQYLDQMQKAASETAADVSLDDAFADILDELNEAGFEATGSPDDFPTEEQAKAAEQQDELRLIRELASQLEDVDTEEGEWVIREAEHLKSQSDRKKAIDYLKRKQKEALMEFLKRKELERKAEQETAIREEIERREEEKRARKEIGDFIMDTIVEGKGARIENLEAFERQGGKVYEPDSWGLRKIEWKGRFNALDGENRLIKPMIGRLWFDKMGEFHPWRYKHSPTPREKKLMAPVEKAGESYFLTVDGEVLPIVSPMEELKAFYENKEEAEVVEGDIILMEPTERHIIYVEILAEELAAFAQRFEEADKQALLGLKDEILAVKDYDEDSNWISVLSSVKECVRKAELSPTVAFIKDRLFLRLAKTARAYDVELDFNGLAELDDYQWEPYGRYDQGVIVQFQRGGKDQFTLIRDGKLLYPIDEALDGVDSFTGKVARVSGQRGKMALYNFILKENGELFSLEWFKFIYPVAHGIFRLRTLDDRYNYLNPGTGALMSDTGYDEAGDFDSSGKALVKQGGEKFYIDRDGKRLQPIRLAASIVVERHFDTAKTGPIPTIEELKARIKERTQEAEDRHISHRFRDQFRELTEAHPEEREALLRLFSVFRQMVNAHIDDKDNGEKIHEDLIIKTLIAKVDQSALSRKLKLTLKDSIYNLRHKKPIWGRVDPLQVPLITAFGVLIDAHPEEEHALFSLIMRLEMRMQQVPKGKRHQRSLRENLRNLVFGKESRLSLKAKRKVYNVILTMMNNPDIQWGGSSADHQTFKREHTERQIIRLCASAEGGRVDEAYQGLQKLLQSGHGRRVSDLKKEALRKLALAFYQHLYELSQAYQAGDRNPVLVKRYKEAEKKTINVLQLANTADPENTQIRQLIDLLKPVSLAGMEKKSTLPPRPVVKRKRTRLWTKLLLLGLLGGVGAGVYYRADLQKAAEGYGLLQPNKENESALAQMGEMQMKQGRFRAARNTYLKLLKISPRSADYHAAYGQILLKLEKIKKAEWHFNYALKLNPGHELARLELEKLKQKR